MSDFYCDACQILWAGDHCKHCGAGGTFKFIINDKAMAELMAFRKFCSVPLEADDQRITSRHDNPDAVVHVEDPIVSLLTAQLQDANKQIAELERQLKVLMHSAAHPPSIAEEPAEFPANALRYSA